jgi:hypothetical protein
MALSFASLLLAGCVNELAQRQAELTRWVGRPETELVSEMGAPNRSYATGGITVLTYEESRVDIIPGSPFYQGYGPYWWGAGPGLAPQALNLRCDTTFTVAGGVVQGFSLRGNDCG